MKLCLQLALISALAWIACGDEPRLLVSKDVLNKYVVEGKDFIIEYSIYNVGNSAAFSVQLSDKSFPLQDFSIVRGSLEAKWDRIGVSNNVSHIVVLKPKTGGYFNMTAATISYAISEDGGKTVQGYSSTFEVGHIMFAKDYDRWFSPHMLDWLAYGLMTSPLLLIPFMLWHRSKTLYGNAPKPKKS